MTVAELIAKLQTLDQDMPIYATGYGDIMPAEPQVMTLAEFFQRDEPGYIIDA
jgi:hypothetical protein